MAAEDIYKAVQAVLLNSEGDPAGVVTEALRAVLEFAEGEGISGVALMEYERRVTELPE